MLVAGGCTVPVILPVVMAKPLPRVTAIDHTLRFDSTSTDAIVVFGFSSVRTVWIRPGAGDGAHWYCSLKSTITRLKPEAGFIVARLPAKTTYAIVATSLDLDPGERAEGPLQNEAVWVFSAEPGKVTYLGGLRLGPWSDHAPSILRDERFKQSEADDFLTSAFPNVPIHVTEGRMDPVYLVADPNRWHTPVHDTSGCF